jgi:pyruvate kinase
MRMTKIICTIGPASEKPEVFREMCLAGMNVARLNFSHGTHEEHRKKIDMIKAVREELDLPIAIMLDTKGPEYRIKTFRDGRITLRDGDPFTFTTRDVIGDETVVSVSYRDLTNDLSVGDHILVNNGLVVFEVTEIDGTEIRCRVINGGVLSDRKSMSFPGKVLGLATNKNAWYKLALSWGVIPHLTEQFPSMEVLNFYALRAAKNRLRLNKGDTVVMTGGNTSGESGNTNVLRIETVE